MTFSSIHSWAQYDQLIQNAQTIKTYGKVVQVIGLVIEGIGPISAIGEMCQIKRKGDGKSIP